MSELYDVRCGAPGYGGHVSGVVSQPVAVGMFDAPYQELSARTQPLTRSFAPRTAPSGWWLLPIVAAGAAIWGLIFWWLL